MCVCVCDGLIESVWVRYFDKKVDGVSAYGQSLSKVFRCMHCTL